MVIIPPSIDKITLIFKSVFNFILISFESFPVMLKDSNSQI